jgi:uncharacterized protein involved in outer membrane biogenesis
VIRRRTVWLAALVAIVALVVLGVATVARLPEIARRAAVWRLESLTQRRITIERLDLNVFTGQMTVHGLQVDDRDEPGPLARAERITARLHRRSLLRLQVWIEELVVERSSVRIVRLGPNRFNISDLLDRPKTPSGLGVTLDRLRIVDGTVVLEDRTLRPARTWRSERITIDGRNLSTRRGDGIADGSTIVAGAPVHVRVEDLRLAPVHFRAHVTVGNVDLGLLRLYLPGDAVVLPESGVLSAGVTVVHDARDGTQISAGARIHRLVLERHGQAMPLATSPETLVTLNDLHLKDGGFAFARAEIEGDLKLTEAVIQPPVTYAFKGTRLVAENVTWPASQAGRVTFAAELPGGGSIDVRGTLQPAPLAADARVKIVGADLGHANRYAAMLGHVSGVLDADARVVATWDRTLRLAVTGAVGAGRVTVGDSRTPAAAPAMTAERVSAIGLDYQWPARLSVASLQVRRATGVVERDAAGTLTLGALRTPAAPPVASGDSSDHVAITPEVTVREARIDGGTLTIVDNAVVPAARAQLTNVTLGLRDVTWPARGRAHVDLAAGTPGGGLLTAAGTADLDQKRASAKLTLKNVDLAQAQPYLPFRGRVSGRADAELDLRARLDPLRLRVRGDVVVTEAGVTDLDQPLLAVERIGVTGLDFGWPLRLSIEQLSVRRPWAKVDRNARGELTLRAAFLARQRPGPPAAPTEGRAAPTPKPEIVIKRAIVEDGGTSIIDDSVEPAARFEIRGTRVEARNVTYPVKIPAEVTLATPTPGGGRLEGRGTFQVDPGRVDLRATLAGVALAPAQPYLPVGARLSGTLDGDARIAATFDPLALTVRGNANLGNLALGDEHRSLLTAERVRSQGVSVEWPGRVRVDTVDVEKPWLLLERDAAGRFPLVALLTPRTAVTPPRPDPQAKPATPLRVEVGTVTVSDGFGRFVDRVPDPDFAEELSAVNLAMLGFSTAPGAVARTTLRATVGPSAPLAISGELSGPAGPRRLDVLLTLGNYQAPRANPYLRTLFGWAARQGTITLAAHYVVDGDDLQATNDVGADDLVVDRAPGSQPPKWPIGLPLDTFLSLLKNGDGDVQLSVPIHGALSSPKFELGDAIASALRGIAVKTVTLPFSLVGRLHVTEDARIESLQVNPVLFDAGTTTLAAGMAAHVDNLATFMRDKPGVRLLIRPVLSIADVTRLKRQALRERVRAQAGERTPTAMRDALTKLYAERFPRRETAPVDEMIAALAEHDPAPTAASGALAERRIATVREALGARGVEAQRLPALGSAAAVEGEGSGRVEFEITE